MPVLAYPARIGQGDANGNLLSDGEYTYTYNHANRLTSVTDGTNAYSYMYNRDGTRTSTTSNGIRTDYVLDIAGSLSQVLMDGEYTYLYGNGRISQTDADSTEYFLGDALGSVRQLVDPEGEVTLAESYEPYGDVLASRGEGASDYAYTGEEYDAGTGLVYLRARYMSTATGRFISQDTWTGDDFQPMSYNSWLYGDSNSINRTDPSGYCSSKLSGEDFLVCEKINRHINPDIILSYAFIKFLGETDCAMQRYPQYFTEPRTPGNFKSDTRQYGIWFHWLGATTPGWWNNDGKKEFTVQRIVGYTF